MWWVLLGVQEHCRRCGKWTVRNQHHLCKQCNHNRRYNASAAILPPTALSATPHSRKRKEYEELEHSQRSVRRKLGREALAAIGVPASALCDHQPTAAAMLPLATAERKRIRALHALKLPGEERMAKRKKQLASTHGTQTASFTLPPKKAGDTERVGAFVTDPLRLVRCVTACSPFVAVGGDKGSDSTKLGVTYSHRNKQKFLPLLIFEGDDDYAGMDELRTPNLTCFRDDSAQHAHIFSVLQHIIDSRPHTFLNGDWPFISAILAHKGPSSAWPCPICIVERNFYLSEESYRLLTDGNSLHPIRTHTPFLTIPSERIVPTPLHLYLGISQRIIYDALKEICGETPVLALVKTVKSKHSAGCGGLSDLHSLNGAEIRRWIKRHDTEKLAISPECLPSLRRSFKARKDLMQTWLERLHEFLLHSGKQKQWDATELFRFRQFLNDIYARWQKVTGIRPFPKLHMLRHAVEFAERHHMLGVVSEAQIESFHFRLNDLYNRHHRNMSQQPLERMRRCLADVAAAAVSPFADLPISSSLPSLAAAPAQQVA